MCIVGVRPKLLEALLDLAARAHRNRRLGGDHREAFEMRREIGDGCEHVAEVGVPVATAHRRADGEKHDIGDHARPH